MLTQFVKSALYTKLIKNHFPKRITNGLIELFPGAFNLDGLNTQNYFLHGEAGTGKSTLAGALGLKFSSNSKGTPICAFLGWCNVTEFLFAIQQTYRTNTPSEDILSKFSKYSILVLDDLGIEKSTDWALQMLYLLVNRRYENELITITTSNYSPEYLYKKMEDGRLVSRLTEDSRIIHCKTQYRK